MPIRHHQTDLRARREDLGVTLQEMAMGLGLSVADVLSIEDGTAPDLQLNRYSAWLTRLEWWPAGKKEREVLAELKERRRFNP
jgi:transcriptional regulator with XRE-family HTH domain